MLKASKSSNIQYFDNNNDLAYKRFTYARRIEAVSSNNQYPIAYLRNQPEGGLVIENAGGKTITVELKYTIGQGHKNYSNYSWVGFEAGARLVNNNVEQLIACYYEDDKPQSEAYEDYLNAKIVSWKKTFSVPVSYGGVNVSKIGLAFSCYPSGNYDEIPFYLLYYKISDSNGNVYYEDCNRYLPYINKYNSVVYRGITNIVKEWSDGTAINSEKTLVNTTTTENYLYSEIINPVFLTEGITYSIHFFAKKSGDVKSVDMYFLSSDYSTTGFITSKTSIPVTTDYLHFTHIFKLTKKSSSSKLPTLRIRFDNNGVATSGNTGTIYIKNVVLSAGRFEDPKFLLSIIPDGSPYERPGVPNYRYTRLFPFSNENKNVNIKITTDDSKIYLMKQAVTNRTFSNLQEYNYEQLNNFCYEGYSYEY